MCAETFATSAALTETRLSVLLTQINYVVRETTGSQNLQGILTKGMVDNKWIASVTVIAFDDRDRIWADIQMTVDWDRHEINLRRHGATLAVNKKAPEGERVSWVIGEIARWFKGYTQKSRLRTTWTIRYVPHIERDRALKDKITKSLGLVYGATRKWIDGAERQEVLADTPEVLDEFSISTHVTTAL